MKQELSKFTPTASMIHAGETVMMAIAHEQVIREVVEPIQQKMLDEYNLEYDVEQYQLDDEFIRWNGLYCKTWKYTYMLRDDDHKLLMVKLHHIYVNEHKFNLKEVGYCPLLSAEQLTREAKRAFAILMMPVTHIDPDNVLCMANGVENFAKLIDLSLRLIAPFVTNPFKQ